MTDEKTEFTPEEQRKRDDLLRRLLKTPPEPRPKREREEKSSDPERPEESTKSRKDKGY